MSTLRCLHPATRAILPVRCAYNVSIPPAAQFHDSPTLEARARTTRDNNRNRGVSAIHRKYPKDPLSVSKVPLPEPVAPEEKRPVTVDSDHGLYGFFTKGGKVLPTPEEDVEHGRAWSVEELRRKSWEDLHKLWWLCVKERNILYTQSLERKRLDPGFGEYEARKKDREINRTQRAIKHVLTERYYAWQEAKELAKLDPQVNLTGHGPAYDAMVFEEPPAPAANEILETPQQQQIPESK
ncbi:50S ribosomal protein L4 [Tirmania nivea]|nr:50S ribosomal protein L4 [Tirmania nivea]